MNNILKIILNAELKLKQTHHSLAAAHTDPMQSLSLIFITSMCQLC